MLITEENFKQIDPKSLLDSNRYREVEDMVISIDAAATFDHAKGYSLMLADKLDALDNKMSPELLAKYIRLLKALQLYSLGAVSDQEKETFFREKLLDVMKLEFVDVRYWIDLVFRLYYRSPEIIEEIRKSIIRGLENNIERLDQNRISIDFQDKNLSPVGKNWLIDYRSFTQGLGKAPNTVVRGSFEEVSYINQSPNVKKISVAERDKLLGLLRLYDWLSFTHFEYDFSFPGQAKEPNGLLDGERHELISQEIADAINNRRKLNSSAIVKPANKEEKILQIKPVIPKQVVPFPSPVPKPPLIVPKPSPSAPPSSGLSIDKLKSELKQSSPALSALEKKYISPVAAPVTSKPLLTPDEIKREVRTPELLAHKTEIAPAAVDDIKFVDDLKKISVNHLRRGNLAMETEKIKAKIAYLAAVNRLFPHEVVNVFEQSPLFKLYLKIGGMLIADRNPDRRAAFEQVTAKLKQEKHETLTLPEFESVADLKKNIERM